MSVGDSGVDHINEIRKDDYYLQRMGDLLLIVEVGHDDHDGVSFNIGAALCFQI